MTTQHKNQYEIIDDYVNLTVFNKKGKSFTAQFDVEDLDKVQSYSHWYAQWNKDFNDYMVETKSKIDQNGKTRYIKPTLQSVILGTSKNAPIRHLNGDLLDNRKCNLEIYNRQQINDYEQLENGDVAIHLKDRYGNIVNKALISREDLDQVVTENYTWISKKKPNGQPYVLTHTPEGPLYLDTYLTNCPSGFYVYHINKNPLDNRRHNLEIKEIETPNNLKEEEKSN